MGLGLRGAARKLGLVFPLVREKGVQRLGAHRNDRHHHALVLSLNLEGSFMKAGQHGLAPSQCPQNLAMPSTPQALSLDGLVVDGGTQ